MSRPSVLREVVLGDVLELAQAMRDFARLWILHANPGVERERITGAIVMLRVFSSAAAELEALPMIYEDQEQRAATLRKIVCLAVARTVGVDDK